MFEYGAIFAVGFLSSFGHCIGMCGGFVTAYTLRLAGPQGRGISRAGLLRAHFLYNAGRILTYGVLGLLFGFTGEVLRLSVGLIGFQAAMQLVAGILMILLALDMGGWIPGGLSERFPGYAAFKQVASRAFRKVTENNIFGLGVVLGFIPCGLVYAAGAKAATSGGAISGMLTMLAFGLGTVPALLMVGLGAQSVSAKFRYQVFRFATLLVIALGIMTTYRGATQLMAPRDIVSENGVVICTH